MPTLEPISVSTPNEEDIEGRILNSYHVPISFQVSDNTDATKSCVEELERVTLLAEFLERKVYLCTGLSL